MSESSNFPETRWSLVIRADETRSIVRNAALEELCQAYWPPVYAFIRSKGYPHADAEDLTQGFFAEFLSHESFARASREKGKLRTFLLGSVTRFMARDHRDRNRIKRGGNVRHVSIDVEFENSHERIVEPVDGETPEAIFERQWALTLLSRVADSLAESYRTKGQGEVFEALRFLISGSGEAAGYAEIATRLGMSESAVKVAAHRLRQRFGEELRRTVADTLPEEADLEEEIRGLMRAFG